MENKSIVIPGGMQSVSAQFLSGAYTKLWNGWGSKNIVPSYNKLYYIISGKFYFNINNKEYEGNPGQLYLLPYNSCQTYHAYNSDSAVKYWVHCNFPTGEKDLFEQISVSPFINVDSKKYVSGLFEKILKHDCPENLSDLLMQKSALLELISYYLEKAEIETPISFENPYFSELMNYISNNIANKITVEDMARLMHLSPNYFIRYFHKNFGVSPLKYILDMRINLSKRLLINNNLSIKEVSEKSGFNTVYYFDHVFKKSTGYTPTDYRIIAINREK